MTEKETPENEPVEDVVETAKEPVEEVAEPASFSEVAAAASNLFKAIRRFGTAPIKEAIGKGTNTVIDTLDTLAGDDRKKPKG